MTKNKLKTKSASKKRKYTKKADKWLNKPAEAEVRVEKNVVWSATMSDELDLLRDMLAAFESMNEDARFRAYAFFKNKHSQYDLDIDAHAI